MSTDTFESDLADRMGAAARNVAGDGVTREGVEQRLAARRVARRRRQGGLALAAAALVVAAGIGAVVVGAGDAPSTEITDEGGGTTEAPSTETRCAVGSNVEGYEGEPTVDCEPTPTTCPPAPPGAPDPILPEGRGGGCPGRSTDDTTTSPSTDARPDDEEAPATTGPTSTVAATTAPATTAPATSAPTTTAPSLVPGQPCSPGSSPDCIDPEGDGSHVYLIGGADCMASPVGGSECADLDGDGHAGYPDSQ